MLQGSSWALWAALALAPPEDPYVEIRALDSAATFEMEGIRGRCADPSRADREAEQAAERAAHIHRTRISLARQGVGATSEEVVALAFQAADAYQKAFECSVQDVRHLEAARELLVGLRAELPDPRAGVTQATDRRIGEIEVLLAARPRRSEAPGAPPPTVEIVSLAGEVRPGPRDTYLGHLALRVEPGAGFMRAGGPPVGFYQRGASLRFAFLARFVASERARVRLLFGPAFAVSRLTDRRAPGAGLLSGDVSLFRMGAQFEVEWRPSTRIPWLSVHPAVELGLELQSYVDPVARQAERATGFQVGGGLALCIWHASVCPVARVLGLPVRFERSVASLITLQFGLSIDVMRWVDVGITRRSGKQR